MKNTLFESNLSSSQAQKSIDSAKKTKCNLILCDVCRSQISIFGQLYCYPNSTSTNSDRVARSIWSKIGITIELAENREATFDIVAQSVSLDPLEN